MKDVWWTDTRLSDTLRKVTIRPYSPAYFAVLAQLPDVRAVLALGESVAVAGRYVALVVDPQGTNELSAAELAALVRDW